MNVLTLISIRLNKIMTTGAQRGTRKENQSGQATLLIKADYHLECGNDSRIDPLIPRAPASYPRTSLIAECSGQPLLLVITAQSWYHGKASNGTSKGKLICSILTVVFSYCRIDHHVVMADESLERLRAIQGGVVTKLVNEAEDINLFASIHFHPINQLSSPSCHHPKDMLRTLLALLPVPLAILILDKGLCSTNFPCCCNW